MATSAQKSNRTETTRPQGDAGFSVNGESRPRRKSPKELAEEAFLAELGRAARFLVTRNGYIVAAFANEDDALMFEGELADVDLAQGEKAEGTTCEVLDRRGRRLGGYWISGSRIMAYVRQ
jgi:hypothetical protein